MGGKDRDNADEYDGRKNWHIAHTEIDGLEAVIHIYCKPNTP